MGQWVRLLIQKRVDVNNEEFYNQTPLHIAAKNGNIEIIKLLISNGERISTPKDYDYNTTSLKSARSKKQHTGC